MDSNNFNNTNNYSNTSNDQQVNFVLGEGPANPGTGPTNYGQIPNGPQKKKGFFSRMNLGKFICLALIFGIIAGGAFYGVNLGAESITKAVKKQQAAASKAAASQNENIDLPESQGKKTTSDLNTTAYDVSSIVKAVMPGVVSITNISVQEVRDWFGRTGTTKGKSLGSGFIVHQSDEELFIATNNHVVEGATTLTVSFVDESSADATIKATDETTDMAVIAVKLADLSQETKETIRVCELGNSSELQMGEPAIAIGNALGYGQSVTTGVISAIDRRLKNGDNTYSVIQTDAAINSGNSGGTLLNARGEVIGINNAKCIIDEVEGVCYAIPINNAKSVIQKAIEGNGGDIKLPAKEIESQSSADKEEKSVKLGISGVNIATAESVKYGVPTGVYITQVSENSVAAKAGLKEEDVICKFDGNDIASIQQLANLVQSHQLGDTVEILYKQASSDYKSVSLTITFE